MTTYGHHHPTCPRSRRAPVGTPCMCPDPEAIEVAEDPREVPIVDLTQVLTDLRAHATKAAASAATLRAAAASAAHAAAYLTSLADTLEGATNADPHP